jgi:hypothetical protein
MATNWLLWSVILLPVLGALTVCAVPKDDAPSARSVAFFWSVITFFASLPPPHLRPQYHRLMEYLDRGLAGVIRGQLLICLVNGFLTWFGLFLLGIQYATVLGTVAGVFSLIPVFGTIASSIPIVLVAIAGGGISDGLLALGVGDFVLRVAILDRLQLGLQGLHLPHRHQAFVSQRKDHEVDDDGEKNDRPPVVPDECVHPFQRREQRDREKSEHTVGDRAHELLVHRAQHIELLRPDEETHVLRRLRKSERLCQELALGLVRAG